MSPRARDGFYVTMGGVALLAVAVGFGRTYAAPMVAGTFHGAFILHVHGAFALAWLLLFLTQALLARATRIVSHRRLGLLGLPIAVGVVVTMVPAGLAQVARETAEGVGAAAVSNLVGVVTSGLLFLGLVAAGILGRRDREVHARWLLLATLVVIWPAWFRWRHWFPSVPRADVWFAVVLPYTWIGVAMLRDRMKRGSVHPVLALGGTFVIIEQSLEVLAYDTGPWRALGQAMYDGLGT